MAERISFVFFSRDDVDNALEQIEDCYNYFDEIVLLDSSSKKEHARLISEKRRRRWNRLRIYYIVALGYAEPIMMYALKKCRYRWALLSGTDERMSQKLKADIHKIIGGTKFAAFSLIRNEEVRRDGKSAYTNWQTRIIRRDKATLRGIIHEEAEIDGSIKKLDPSDYYMDHILELGGRAGFRGGGGLGYGIMERFLRMSYKSFNERLVDYLYKVTVPERKDSAGSFGMSLNLLLLLYEKLLHKNLEDEISDFDYFNFYFMYNLAVELAARRPGSVFNAWNQAKRSLKNIRTWRDDPEGKNDFQISKELYRIGLIKFLEFDRESTITKLNKRYGAKEGGIDLLVKLLRLRYEKGKRWLD